MLTSRRLQGVGTPVHHHSSRTRSAVAGLPAPRAHRTASDDTHAQRRRCAARAAAAAPASAPSATPSSSTTAWQAWDAVLPHFRKAAPAREPNAADRSALAAAVSAAAAAFKPKPSLKIPSLDDLGDDVPKNLHKRLELVARVQLAHYLDMPLAEMPATICEFTTTDIAAACSVAGVKIVQGAKRTALVSVVVTETERQMTWSRLEGLLLHWAVSRKAPPAEKWELPPRGWKTLPDTTVDAGGAWQTGMEKHPLPEPDGALGPQPMYTMLASLPLEGPLAEGGLIFVLKSGSTGQNTKWLKDAKTSADFFLDLQELKMVMQ